MPFPTQISNVIYLAIVLVLCMYVIAIYNNLTRLKNNVRKAWANLEKILKQRHNELTQLISISKQYLHKDQSIVDQLSELYDQSEQARQQGNVEALGKTEGMLTLALGNVFALAENYAPLKADETYQNLYQRIIALQNSLTDKRDLYNQSATLNNIQIQQFPDIFVASMFNFKPFRTLEFADPQTRDVLDNK